MPPENLFPAEGTLTRTEQDGVHGAFSEIAHHYDKPGAYFASVRITSQRDGNAGDVFTQVKNLDRVRIVVE